MEGAGTAVPHEKALVRLQYVGINARTGEVFDSSWLAGEPVVFPLAQVIPGFATGLVGKPVGSRVAIAIPSEDGYGAQGNPQSRIEPDDTLLFVVDILDTELAGPEGWSSPAARPAAGQRGRRRAADHHPRRPARADRRAEWKR